jgi:hypothetical protein
MRLACIWFLTGGLLLPFCRAHAQGGDSTGAVENAPTVCNDGSIAVYVVWAYMDEEYILKGDLWEIQGWDGVAPGKCQVIGEVKRYYAVNPFHKAHAQTLLAFAFSDSTGRWGAARIADNTDGIFKPSNEQICVTQDKFARYHSVSQGGPAADCAVSGYFLIPASLEYTAETHYGYYGGQMAYSNPRDYLHVKLGPSDRAISLGPQSPSHAAVEAGTNPAPKADPAISEAQSKAAWLKWVQEDVSEYIAASATGFEAYKKGSSNSAAGNRVWESNVKPSAAKGCWVVQGDATATFSCLLSTGADLNTLRAYYTQLTDDVALSLPPGWKVEQGQPFGPDLPSKGYSAATGAHGEVWIGRADSGSEYELHYQLVSAPLGARAAATPVDDPIGQGGFIKPASGKP